MVFGKAFTRPGKVKMRLPLMLGLLLAAALAAAAVAYAVSHRNPPPSPEKITFGIVMTDNAALVYVAAELSLFSKYGVEPSIKEYDVGSSVIEDLQQGKLDFAVTSEFALVSEAFARNDLLAVASVALSDNIRLVARRDRGIEAPDDLKGTTIGVLRGTTCEFFLDTFLAFNGILDREVKIVNIKPSDAASGILARNMDAAMLWDPYAYRLATALGRNAVVWDGQNGQDYYVLLVSTKEFIGLHEAAVEDVLRALLDAERFVESNPEAAKKIIRKRFQYDSAYTAWLWQKSKLKLSLTQDLLIHMEDEGRWLKKKGFHDSSQIPNYYADMYLVALEKVDPEAVSIIH